jgi:hypothetical protein
MVFRVRVSGGKITGAEFKDVEGGRRWEEAYYHAPKGAKVTFRGQVLTTPWGTDTLKRYDMYQLDMQENVYEPIYVDLGGLAGAFGDWVRPYRASDSRYAYVYGNGRDGESDRPRVYTNFAALRYTNPEFGDRYSALQDLMDGYIQTIKQALYDTKINDFAALTTPYEEIPARTGTFNQRNSSWNRGWDNWQKAEASAADKWKEMFPQWEVRIGGVEIPTVETMVVTTRIRLLRGDGVPRYEQWLAIWLRQANGEWKISYFPGSIGLFSRSTSEWKAVQQDN